MKLQACMIAGYPAPYLTYALRSIEKAVDCFLIVVTEPFDYYDHKNTAIVMEDIRKFKGETNKPVRVVSSRVESLHEARQVYVDNLDKDATHIFQIDSDEVYEFYGCDKLVKRLLVSRPDIFMLIPRFLNYWVDISHINEGFGADQGRIFKRVPGMHYEANGESGFERLTDLQGREMNCYSNIYPPAQLTLSRLHHYAYAMEPEYIRVKLERYVSMSNPDWAPERVLDRVSQHSFFMGADTFEYKNVPSVLADKPQNFKGDY